MNLIAGATGMLGSEICRLLREQGKRVRALVRSTSNPERLADLGGLGVELVQGDLKDAATLEEACRGASAVISTASSTVSRQAGDSIDSVDRQGQLNLIEAAERDGENHWLQSRIMQVSRLATIGEMAAGIAHEISQPLTAINNYTRACELLLGNDNDVTRPVFAFSTCC